MGTCKPKVSDVVILSNLNSYSHYRPKDHEELFNLRHAQARNVIERIFGVLKRRFKLSTIAPEYPLKTQAMFVVAEGVLHNFIRVHDPDDDTSNLDNTWMESLQMFGGSRAYAISNGSEMDEEDIQDGELSSEITSEERERAMKHRDDIAKAMWQQYQQVLREREH